MTRTPGDEAELVRRVRETDGPPGGAAPVVTGGARLGRREKAARAAVGPSEPIFSLGAPPFSGIREHEPRDLTVTVGAGTRCSDLRAALAEQGQWVPALELGPARSVGGLVAAGEPGPFDRSHGTIRRHLLAVRVVTWAGETQRWGRAVVKNVAGYDVKALWCGSHGRLGVLTEVTLRTWPRPERGAWLGIEGDATSPVAELADAVRPDAAVVMAGSDVGGRTLLGLLGSPESVETRRRAAESWLRRRGFEIDAVEETLVPREARRAVDSPREGSTRTARPSAERLVDGLRFRASVPPTELGALVRRLATVGAPFGLRAEALPELGVARFGLPRGGDPEETVAGREALFRAAGEARIALEAGGPADLEAARARRDPGRVPLEQSVARSLGGLGRHWLGDWV